MKQAPDRWKLFGEGIQWEVAKDARLPHADHVEMSGRHISAILRYGVDADRRFHVTRELIWPTLRTRASDVRGYLRRGYGPEVEPRLFLNGVPFDLPPAREINWLGFLWVKHEPTPEGIHVSRYLNVSPDRRVFAEEWNLNWSADINPDVVTAVLESPVAEDTEGVYGTYRLRSYLRAPELGRGSMGCRFVVSVVATTGDDPEAETLSRDLGGEKDAEEARWRYYRRNRIFGWDGTTAHFQPAGRTLDAKIVERLFDLAKLRAAESLFETKMGLVHSPGGGNYYGGIWNNDQCEYSGPLFGYLGDADANRAALTAYRNFAPYMTPDFKPIPTSLEMEGTVEIHAGGDRGDAAMYASGAARYVLATGDRAVAEELQPYIAWCLEYCHRKLNQSGVPMSDCDELERRFPAGDANLSTACLYYDGLRRAADLARDLGRPAHAANYDARADKLEKAIESHFGATVSGYETYRYYDGNQTLRAWICLPLAFGIHQRATGTLDALFSRRLWTPDGVSTEEGKPDYWDRATLYALRGAFFAGDTKRAHDRLVAYSRRRLLGDHVPYPVEAYPEGGKAHLSAESALYCRVLVEGVFGLVPRGLRRFDLTPRVPPGWPGMSLFLPAFGHQISVRADAEGDDRTRVRVTLKPGGEIYSADGPNGMTHAIILPD